MLVGRLLGHLFIYVPKTLLNNVHMCLLYFLMFQFTWQEQIDPLCHFLRAHCSVVFAEPTAKDAPEMRAARDIWDA